MVPKKTFSGRLLSFLSQHPLCHKIGIIYSLVDRAILLSHPYFHQKNLELCINILLDNGYPLEVIFNKINLRLKTLYNGKLSYTSDTRHGIPNDVSTSDTRKKFFVIPYIKKVSEVAASVIDKSETIIGYRVINKLNKFVKVHKDVNQLAVNNNVVYKIPCKGCNASYVGQTKRQLRTRLKEHMNNIKLDPTKHSVISEHIIDCGHSFDWNKVSILDSESNFHKRIISEMIHIKEQKNGINSNKDTELLDNSYFDLLGELANEKF